MNERGNGIDEEFSKDLNKAINIGIASIVGAFIPVIGLLLAVIALVVGSSVPKNKYTESKKNTLTMIVIIGIGLSLISGMLYYALYNNGLEQAEAERQTQAQQADDARQAEQSRQFLVSQQLDTCLQQAETTYWDYVKLNSTSQTLQADGRVIYTAHERVWDTAEVNKVIAKDDCYKRYPNL